jgi:hypothetical protein
MRRRHFMALLSGVSLVWPFAARAQQTERIRNVGILLGSTDNPEARRLLDAFMEFPFRSRVLSNGFGQSPHRRPLPHTSGDWPTCGLEQSLGLGPRSNPILWW